MRAVLIVVALAALAVSVRASERKPGTVGHLLYECAFVNTKPTGKAADTIRFALARSCASYIMGIYHGYTLSDHFDFDRQAGRVRRVCKPLTDEAYNDSRRLVSDVVTALKQMIAKYPGIVDEPAEGAVLTVMAGGLKCTGAQTRAFK